MTSINHNVSIIIHGGCGSFDFSEPIEKQAFDQKQIELSKIIDSGWKQLLAGADAVTTVEHVINLLEAAPCFNAGIGGALDINKQVTLDASIMRGDTLAAGAVAKLKNIPHAISVARRVMEDSNHILLVESGANKFAAEHGFSELASEDFITDLQLHWWNKSKTANPNSNKSTVGAVVLDRSGLIAAGTSTGGMTKNLYGRVGDSPIIGAGTYADNSLGGASATGYGEQIMRVTLTKHSLDLTRYKSLTAMDACQEAINDIGKLKNGVAGIIMIDSAGKVGFACNDDYLASAYMTTELDKPVVQMKLDT